VVDFKKFFSNGPVGAFHHLPGLFFEHILLHLQHILVCPLNWVPCIPEDLAEATDAAIQVANQWGKKGV